MGMKLIVNKVRLSFSKLSQSSELYCVAKIFHLSCKAFCVKKGQVILIVFPGFLGMVGDFEISNIININIWNSETNKREICVVLKDIIIYP